MTRGFAGSGRQKKQVKPHRQPAAIRDGSKARRAAVYLAIAVLAVVPFGLGKYFELNVPGAFDSGAYAYSAKHILEGARIGVDEKPSARLGTLLVNMLGVWLFGFDDIGPKIVQGVMQAAALALMFIALKRLYGMLAAAIGVIIASAYLSAPLIAKFGNVKEQYMIACMVMGISCFVMYQLSGKWWQAILSGAFLSWAPLFKETGTSAIGATALFVIAQPVLRHRTVKQTGKDILLLLAGAVIGVAPLYIWIIGWDIGMSLPYKFVWTTAATLLPAKEAAVGQAKAAGDYVQTSRALVPFAMQWPRVLRYYGLLVLPVGLALASILTRWVRMIMGRSGKFLPAGRKQYDRFVLLFATWWLLDMAFVWISPRSYEQYYLPLNASAAMLGGYVITVYADKFKTTVFKGRWLIAGAAGFVCMVAMSWHIFFGIGKSPHSGRAYGEKRRGYLQKYQEISTRRLKSFKGPWEIAGEYIRQHSNPDDRIYVWGWYPGIYVKAQRFSAASQAFMMPRPAPAKLAEQIGETLAEFEQHRPKFIVDTRKRNIPMVRPPYELWPVAPKGFMGSQRAGFVPPDPAISARYDDWWAAGLRKRFDEAEAERYKILAPLRKFVMDNYQIVEPTKFVQISNGRNLYHRMFGEHIVFKLKEPSGK